MIEEKEEKWKTIEWNPDYQVSSVGRVKSLKYGKERILKPEKNKKGYLMVALYNKRKRKFFSIHRLVCESFLKNTYNLPEVNHRNEDKTDNRVENLEYCDRKYNVNYGTGNERIAKKLSKVKKGVYNTKKSKPVKCLENGKIYPSISEVHRQFGFSQGNICECCNKKRKSAYNLHWEFV